MQPPYHQALDQSWIAEAVMQLQASVSSLTTEVRNLTKTVDDQGKKLDRVRLAVYCAAAVVVVLVGLAGFLLNKGTDVLIGLPKH